MPKGFTVLDVFELEFASTDDDPSATPRVDDVEVAVQARDITLELR
jgi:hypothetical protein